MSTGRRVVLTGVGLVTPLGSGRGEQIFRHVLANRSGIRPLEGVTLPSQCNVSVAGQVPRGVGEELYDDAALKNRTDTSLFIRYALTAAQYALQDARLEDFATYDKTRVGVAIGNGGIGSITEISQTQTTLQDSYRKVSPYFVPKILVNMAAGHVSIKHGLQGPLSSVATACAAGLHSVGDAYHFIRFGLADAMLAGGSDACIDTLSIVGFNRMKALSNDSQSSASRPFDTTRSGFVIAEGAGVLVLEAMDQAIARGAPLLAEVVGYGLSADAHHATSPSPEGLGAKLSMSHALRSAGITMKDVDYINAHATSTPMGDGIEVGAIASCLREAEAASSTPRKLYISSTKGHTGHLLGAAGAVELGFTAMALKQSTLPTTLNLASLDPNCAAEQVEHLQGSSPLDFEARHGRPVEYVLKNSFGFGGTNASIVLRRVRG